ncbi:MAG: hypothetical protein CBC04_04645 [Verrucomicrobia bacterium TMED44]|nr:MAG: hypothetical protein CBC04_04645 [Verrucomicrobia bacterium TMED44]
MKKLHPIIYSVFFLYSLLLFIGCQGIKQTASSPRNSVEIVLFDGKDLDDWEITDFAGKGEIFIDENESLVLEMGAELSGLHWKGQDLPKSNYEISLQAKRTMGSDFFCGLTFPYQESHATLVLGGWGGSLIGISSLDDFDASENETGDAYIFEDQQWYDIKLRVTDEEFTVWIDKESVIDCEVVGRKVSMRSGEIEMSVPLGITTFATTGKFKNISLKKIE